jgi:hypothetical protein
MKTTIIVNLQIEGLHQWKDAREKLPIVGFLADKHRHTFFIILEKLVSHADRDVELICFKREVVNFINNRYFSEELQCVDFKNSSCEMISQELLEVFELETCVVMEDNEVGAKVYKS